MTLSQLGLILDIVGVSILFFNGLPSKYIVDPESGGNLALGFDAENEEDVKELADIKRSNKNIKRWANVSLALIFIGFALQYWGTTCTTKLF